MLRYSDFQKQEIAKQEYEYYRMHQSVVIDDGLGGKLIIGYVSEIENTLSGFQAYLVTDIKMPTNPTPEDYAKVNKVTMLYRGSTTPDKLFVEPGDVVADWGVNNAPLALRLSVPDWVPTRATVQLRKAANYTNQAMNKYPNAQFDFYGHSLASMTVQYSVVSVEAQYVSRIGEVYVYNGPNTYRILTEQQREQARLLRERVYNYVDPLDMAGFGYDQQEGAVGQVFVVNTRIADEGFVAQHMWGGYRYDAYGNMIDKNDKRVHALGTNPIDIDGDGIDDFKVDEVISGYRNYFANSFETRYGTLSSVPPIHIDAAVLETLSRNMMHLMAADMNMVRNIVEKCQLKNAAIRSSFETRKQQVSENIKTVLAANGLTTVFDSLEQSLGKLVAQQSLFERLAISRSLSDPFANDETPYVHHGWLNINLFNFEIERVKAECAQLAEMAQQEKRHEEVSFMNRPIGLKSWQSIEYVTRELVASSNTLFEGTGFREGKTDGISESLTDVFEVQFHDIAELNRMLVNTAELISGIAQNFTATDVWLQENWRNGRFQGSANQIAVPMSYTAHLQRTHILDDVQDVLQAFDQQVAEKSGAYATKVATMYTHTFATLSHTLADWLLAIKSCEGTVVALRNQFSEDIYVERWETVNQQMIRRKSYWGKVSALYPQNFKENILTLQNEVFPLRGQLEEADRQINTARYRLQSLHPLLKRLIEEGVYNALDLDEIVASQNTSGHIISKMMTELTFVRDTISGAMSGQAATEMGKHINLLIQRLDYYRQLIGDCFGHQRTLNMGASAGLMNPAPLLSLND